MRTRSLNPRLGPGWLAVAATLLGVALACTQARRPPQSLPSASWLALLPDGEEKRRFVLDCTGCHLFDESIARRDGKPRSVEDWRGATSRMLRYAGAGTGFPVIAAARDSNDTAEWLARHLGNRSPSPPRRRRVTEGRAEIVEFPLPVAQDLPHDVAVDAGGQVVVTGMFTHRMYVLDPDSARFSERGIPIENANPRAVEVDPDGRWWVVFGGPQRIGRFDPVGQDWESWAIGTYPHSLALDRQGGVWFNGHFTRDPGRIGRLDPGAGAASSFDVPRHPTLASAGGPVPYEIRVSPDGTVWGSELQGNRIFALPPARDSFRVFEMPLPASGPRRFDVDANGVLWIPAYASNHLVRFDPATARFESFLLPIADALPYVVRVDDVRGWVWIGTAAADALLKFDPRTRGFEVFPLPSRGALVRHLAVDPRTHDVWLAYGASPGALSARIARVRPAP